MAFMSFFYKYVLFSCVHCDSSLFILFISDFNLNDTKLKII